MTYIVGMMLMLSRLVLRCLLLTQVYGLKQEMLARIQVLSAPQTFQQILTGRLIKACAN